MKYLILGDDVEKTVSSPDKVAEAIRPPWDRAQLRNAVAEMQPGDYMAVDQFDVIALSGNKKEFK